MRSASAAGEFYPENREELISLLTSLESEAKHWSRHTSGEVSGIIIPHAGYLFSGKTAMTGYLTLKESVSDNFILIGPKHNARPHRTSIYPSGNWATPLGSLEVDKRLPAALVEHNNAFVPDEVAHTDEYSLEVQIPFLQYIYGDRIEITPILMGNQEKKEALKIARTLYEMDLKIPILVSSDLNHYEKLYTTIRKDSLLIDTITSLDVNRFYRVLEREKVTACGFGPIAVLMEYTRLQQGRIEMIDHSTSYHYTGDINRVVGYASLASFI